MAEAEGGERNAPQEQQEQQQQQQQQEQQVPLSPSSENKKVESASSNGNGNGNDNDNGSKASRIDVSKWLADNKLTNKEKEIKERNVSIEELAEMNPDQFKTFAEEIGLDTLARKRFLKALQQLKPGSSNPPSMVPSQSVDKSQNSLTSILGGLGLIQYRTKEDGSPVVVTPQEHEMITQLYEKFIRTALLVQNLNGCSQILEFGTQQCKDDINKKMEYVLQQLGERKKTLKEDMLQLRVQKTEKLEQQLQLLRSYQSELEDGKRQFEQVIADASSDVHTRKKKIISLVNDLTGRKDIQLVLITQPKFRLAFENQMVTNFLDQFSIDDCDQPPIPVLKITKIGFDSITIELNCDDEVLVNKATELVVEVALIHTDSKVKPKKRNLKKAIKNKKDKKKKKKSSDSEASGSDSDEKESDNESEKESDEEKSEKDSEEDSEAKDSAEEEDEEEEEEESEADGESAEESEEKEEKKKKRKKSKKDGVDKEKNKKDETLLTETTLTTTSPTSATIGEVKKSDSPGPSEVSGDKEKEKDKEEVSKVDLKEVDMTKLEWEECNIVTIPRKYLDVSRYKPTRKYPCVVKQLLDKSEYAVRARAKNSSGWGDWCTPQTFVTKKLVIDSKILKSKEKSQLIRWLPKKDRKKKWKLLFRASKHGYNGAQFHAKCDNKGAPTVSVIESTLNHVFGGYTTLPWTSSNNYAQDKDSWIFLVRASKNTTPKSGKWKVTQTQYSVYHGASYGPSFGGGYDFYLASGCNTNNSSYANAGHSYACPKNNALLAGQYNFMVKDFEVFALTK